MVSAIKDVVPDGKEIIVNLLVKTGNMDLNVRKSVVHFVFGLEYAILKPVHVWMVAKKDGQETSALKFQFKMTETRLQTCLL